MERPTQIQFARKEADQLQLLVCDLDNTLYDWIDYFVPAFYAMVDEAVKIMGCDRDALLADLRAVHQKHHDTEHPFALLETNTVARHFRNQDLKSRAHQLDSAFHAFNSVRKSHLRLYDGVSETLELLKSRGVKLVAHTEGKLHAVFSRLSRLEVLDKFSAIYCRERSKIVGVSDRAGEKWLSRFASIPYRELPHEDRKPNARVLLDICASEGVAPSRACYVGDSLSKDIFMAKSAGVFAVWAKYGNRVDSLLYSSLVAVSHWTPSDVERERALKSASQDTIPDAVLETSFKELQPLFLDNGELK